jgi:hypothetical protein
VARVAPRSNTVSSSSSSTPSTARWCVAVPAATALAALVPHNHLPNAFLVGPTPF